MPRPPAVSKQELLLAAREVLREKGFSGTTLEVATRCGVSEPTLFRRFPTKLDLFRAALLLEELPDWVQTLQCARPGSPAALVDVGMEFLDYCRKEMPLWAVILANPTVTEARYRKKNRPIVEQACLDYFTEEIRRGALRVSDPLVASLVFSGSLHALARADSPLVSRVEDRRFVQSVVDLIYLPDVR